MARLEQLMRLLDADPADADIAYMIAQEHAKAGADTEAIAWYDRCLELDPGYHYAYFHKARSLEAMGRGEEIATVLRAGLERARSDGAPKAIEELGGYLSQVGG